VNIGDLVRDPGTGQLSGSKLWKHVWNAACLWAFAFLVLRGHITTALDIAIFMAISGGSEVASKLVSMRFGGGAPAAAPPSEAAKP
jgi:hypothetical protein